MGRQQGPDRLIGRYDSNGRPDSNGRRVVYQRGGERRSRSFSSPKAAARFIQDLEAELNGASCQTIGGAIRAWLEEAERRGLKPNSIRIYRDAVSAYLGAAEGWLLRSVDAKWAETRFKEVCSAARPNTGKPPSVQTQIGYLKAAQLFGAWCVLKQYLPANPFAGLTVEGKPNRRKKQHKIDEVRKFLDTCRLVAAEGDEAGIAAELTYWLAARASEIACRRVRDVDDGGRVLWIEDGKTEESEGAVPIPVDDAPHLRPALLRLIAGRGPDEFLFPAAGRVKHPRLWLLKAVQRICRRAGVTVVTTHALRGRASTAGARRGMLSKAIAAELRQASGGRIAEQHYIDPAALQEGQQRRLADLLLGGRPSKGEAIIGVLLARGLTVDTAEQARLLKAEEPALDRWLMHAGTVGASTELA